MNPSAIKITPQSKSYFVFSGGEVHCKIPYEISRQGTIDKLGADYSIKSITCLDYTMNGFMAVCELKQILDREGTKVDLYYPYFPYARQDRIIQRDEPFSLKIFCDMINAQKFNSVTIHDPHSDVTPALLNNCTVVEQHIIAASVIPQKLKDDHSVLFVSPDAGAYKKLSKYMPHDERIAIGVKKRGVKGEIISTNVYSETEIKDKTCVIVDDICDGGRTFIELAKALKRCCAASVHLYVTHGIFSQGYEELAKHIDQIYTTDTVWRKDHPKFVTVKNVI